MIAVELFLRDASSVAFLAIGFGNVMDFAELMAVGVLLGGATFVVGGTLLGIGFAITVFAALLDSGCMGSGLATCMGSDCVILLMGITIPMAAKQ